MELNEVIKLYREKLDYTQKQVADLLNVTDRAVYNYEAGIRTPDIFVLRLLKKHLHIPAEYILGDVEMKMTHTPLFTKEDFLRFCAKWEWMEQGCDLDFDFVKKTESGYSYTVLADEPYQFFLHHGQIIWNHPNWNAEFIESFDSLLDELKNKVLFDNPEIFHVYFVSDDNESFSFQIKGYESDSEEDTFVLANIYACEQRIGTLTCANDLSIQKAN